MKHFKGATPSFLAILVTAFFMGISFSVEGIAGADNGEDEDTGITVDANGVPMEIPVHIERRFAQILEDPKNRPEEPFEEIQTSRSDGRLFFRFEGHETDRGNPARYEPLLHGWKSPLSLPPIPTEQLRALFKRVPKGAGTPLAVETDSSMWAPAIYESFMVDVTTEGAARYYLNTKLTRVVYDSRSDGLVMPQSSFSVPLAQVEERVFPSPKAFISIPQKPQDHTYYVQAEGEDPIAMLVLGFQEAPDEKASPSRFAFVTPRSTLERRERDLRVYRIPFGLLRTTFRAHHEALLVKMRKSQTPLPQWVEHFRFPIAISEKDRTFTQAFITLRAGLNNVLERMKEMTPIFLQIPCRDVVAAAG